MTRYSRLAAFITSRGVTVVPKETSRLMRFLAVFLGAGFMENYATTIGSTIYVPKKLVGDFGVLAHEFVHAHAARAEGNFSFSFKYLFPQVLTPLALLAFLSLVWFPLIGFALFLVCAVPLPAPWRLRYELNAYRMSLLAQYLEYGRPLADGWVLRQFYGQTYYYGSFDIQKDYNELLKDILEGRPLGQPYDMILAVLKD